MQMDTSARPRRLGTLARDTRGEVVLLNDKGTAFATNERVLLAWHLCDGQRPVQELKQEFLEKTGDLCENSLDELPLILMKLKDVELIELNQGAA